MSKVGIIDYGMGNIHSVSKALENLGEEILLVKNNKQLKDCKALILPGVGSFDPAINNLSNTELIIDIIKELYAKDDHFSLIDLGTGSGCIISTLLLEFPNASGIGSDISENALNIAQLNAKK